ncbi:TetR family transcriptional regulator [Nonomuraea sp. NPDC003804]|uniref:TetR family transcriptional regulator n=1 Tax=Nonomuraea sp. NPDC003804 TaxID=3154547 RepID=UPI0033B37E94
MGLRERKKEKTRLAIIDAAVDLFLEQGYEATTVEQIAGAVEISARTFFRYFTSKEHVVLWFHDHSEGIVSEALACRPGDEPPFVSLLQALRVMLHEFTGATSEDTARFLKMRQLMQANPALAGKSVARGVETERRLAVEIARRQGRDAETDQLPHLVVAYAMATVRVGFECPRPQEIENDLPAMFERVEEALVLAQRSFRPGWDLGG